MINKINLGFGKERSFLKKEKIVKIYNKGNIIISRPKSAKNNYQIISIKKYENNQNKINKIDSNINKINKKKKDNIKELIEIEEDKRKNIGFILRKSFKDEELENIIDFGPSPKKNRINLNKKEEKEEIPKKIKPYIPDIVYNEPNEINERYLKRTINIFKENEFIINKVNELLKNSKIINEEKIKKEKGSELIKINNEKNKIRQYIDNRRKEIKNKDKKKQQKIFFESENIKVDNLKNNTNKIKNDEEKDDNNKKEDKKIKKGKGFIEIIDIKKDLKYIIAEKWLEDSKEDCEKMKELIIEIDQKIKEDKNILKNKENSTKKNIEITSKDKAKQLISEVKNNVDINNFNINKLNKEEQQLLKGAKRYDPTQRKKYIKNEKIDKNKEPILISSINSIKELKEVNNNMNEELKKKNKLDKKEKEISKEWKNNNECAKAYLNNFKKGNRININKIKEKKNIELENKNDIYNYIYMPKEYENNWYNKKDTNDKTEYKHPFLIYDD